MNDIGTMLHYLGGGSAENPEKYYGKTINNALLKDDVFIIKFTDGIQIEITDEGQDCCEFRYMTCDDDLSFLNNKILTKIIVKDGGIKDEKYETHEIAFLEIHTSEGSVQFATHNKHNGYYGGFVLNIKEVKNDRKNEEV